MIIVGLTGGIGSGKSTVANIFRELGVPVYDSDVEAKQLMVSSSKIKNALVDLLGKKSYVDGDLNRDYIAGKVFKDPYLLHQLNEIVHPVVQKHFEEWVSDQSSNYVIQETALIFENEAEKRYDYVILVTAPKNIRIQRVVGRDGATEEEVLDRMKNQMGDDEKLEKTQFHIENIDLATTRKEVEKLHEKLDRQRP